MSILQTNKLSGPAESEFTIYTESDAHINVSGTFSIGSSGSISIPVGTTSERPASASAGMIRINSESWLLEVYDGTGWIYITTP